MAKFEETKQASLSYQEVEVVIDEERFVRNEAKEYAADDHYINPEGNNFSTQFMARLLENRNSLLQDLMQAIIGCIRTQKTLSHRQNHSPIRYGSLNPSVRIREVPPRDHKQG